jgi:hypothetical protein
MEEPKIITSFTNYSSSQLDEMDKALDKLIEYKAKAGPEAKEFVLKKAQEMMSNINDMKTSLELNLSGLSINPLFSLPTSISKIEEAVGAVNKLISCFEQQKKMIETMILGLQESQIKLAMLAAKAASLIS